MHFHVPVHLNGGQTTQPQLRALLRGLVGGPAPLTRHLEARDLYVGCAPGRHATTDDATLVDGLARELDWVSRELLELGLEPVA